MFYISGCTWSLRICHLRHSPVAVRDLHLPESTRDQEQNPRRNICHVQTTILPIKILPMKYFKNMAGNYILSVNNIATEVNMYC